VAFKRGCIKVAHTNFFTIRREVTHALPMGHFDQGAFFLYLQTVCALSKTNLVRQHKCNLTFHVLEWPSRTTIHCWLMWIHFFSSLPLISFPLNLSSPSPSTAWRRALLPWVKVIMSFSAESSTCTPYCRKEVSLPCLFPSLKRMRPQLALTPRMFAFFPDFS